MKWPLVGLSFVMLLTGCRRPVDKQLVGEWLSGCSIDICTITTLRADHTFCDQFDEKDISGPSVCGTWRLIGDQLVLHADWNALNSERLVGQEMHYRISGFRSDTFYGKYAEDDRWSFQWRRVK